MPGRDSSFQRDRDFLLRNQIGSWLERGELEAKFFCSPAEIAQEALFVLLFIVGLALFDIGGAELEYAIEQSCKFVSAGLNGGWCAQSSFDAADKRPDGRLALHCSLGSQSEHRR